MLKILNTISVLSLSVLMTACMGGGKGGSGGSEGAAVRMRLIDAPVAGVQYIVDGNSDITLADGSFYCLEDQPSVQFFIGGIQLGSVACEAGAHVYPMDLISEGGAVTINNFDTSSIAAKAALLLVTLNASSTSDQPETYNGTNFGPSSLNVAQVYRTLLQGYDDSIFDPANEAQFISLINDIRCYNTYGGALAGCAAAHPSDINAMPTPTGVFYVATGTTVNTGATALATNIAGYDVYSLYLDATSLEGALEGVVHHMQNSIQVYGTGN
jgi:hypothetical protein